LAAFGNPLPRIGTKDVGKMFSKHQSQNSFRSIVMRRSFTSAGNGKRYQPEVQGVMLTQFLQGESTLFRDQDIATWLDNCNNSLICNVITQKTCIPFFSRFRSNFCGILLRKTDPERSVCSDFFLLKITLSK